MLCSIIYRRLFFSLLQSSERSLKLEHITAAVVKELKSSCSECGPEMIDSQLFFCNAESPSFLTYRARLEGTSETDSSSLVSLIEAWVRGGEASLIMTGVQMSLDSSCAVAISSLNEPECSPSHTPTATSSPSTDMPAVERSSDEEPVQAIIGGIVAVVIVLIITIAIAIVIIIVVLILKNRRGEVSLKNNSDKKYVWCGSIDSLSSYDDLLAYTVLSETVCVVKHK